MIAALLADGYWVGILSNSHQAINHLMVGALRVAKRQGIDVSVVKKATARRPETEIDEDWVVVASVYTNEDAWASNAQLIGGAPVRATWCCRATRCSSASLSRACTRAARATRRWSALLDSAATNAPDRGIFLATTWRMHPDVCRFIADEVYDGRLEPEAHKVNRTLVLAGDARALLKPAGIAHAPLRHEGCSQCSEPEARLVVELRPAKPSKINHPYFLVQVWRTSFRQVLHTHVIFRFEPVYKKRFERGNHVSVSR